MLLCMCHLMYRGICVDGVCVCTACVTASFTEWDSYW